MPFSLGSPCRDESGPSISSAQLHLHCPHKRKGRRGLCKTSRLGWNAFGIVEMCFERVDIRRNVLEERDRTESASADS